MWDSKIAALIFFRHPFFAAFPLSLVCLMDGMMITLA
jgi:hypothetical protein